MNFCKDGTFQIPPRALLLFSIVPGGAGGGRVRDHSSFPEDGTFQIPSRNPFQTFQNIRDDNFHYKASRTCVTKTNYLCETRNPSSSVGSCSLKKRWWEDLFQKNTAARARTSARLMGTRLQRQSQPISVCGERGVTQKHCLPVGCLGYSASVDNVAAISFSGAGVRNHCGCLG